jgi:uncharacterized protein
LRVFLDSNILFSAAKTDGAVRRFLGLLRNQGHECWADPYVVEEARRNLVLTHSARPDGLDSVLLQVHVAPRHVIDVALEESLPIAGKDRPILAAAIRLRCGALLTGDRTHFGTLYGKTVHGVAVHSPRSLAEALLPRSPAGGER